MRIYAISIGLLVAGCCLFSSPQVNATTPNTYTYSTIDFDDATGTVLATGHTQADYQTGAYYQRTGASLSLKDANGTQLASQQQQAYGVTVDVSAQTDGYADQQYQVATGHYILATYYFYNYYNQGQYMSGYDDQYNYTAVEGQNSSYSDSYDYYGNGPLVVSQYTNDFILGQTKKTVKVGTPDHVLVWADYFDPNPNSCSPQGVMRTLKYKLVTFDGKGVGRASIKEDPGGTIIDSCGNEEVTIGRDCAPRADKTSIFADILFTACAPQGTTDCGFDINPNLLQWCPITGAPVTVAKVVYNVRFTQITVKGSPTGYTQGTKFFADGRTEAP
jgi:hypothetical protein